MKAMNQDHAKIFCLKINGKFSSFSQGREMRKSCFIQYFKNKTEL